MWPSPASDAPTRRDPLVALLSEVVGGPLGRRASRHPWWTPRRVALATTVATLLLALGVSALGPGTPPGPVRLALLTVAALGTAWLLASADRDSAGGGWGAMGWAAAPLLVLHATDGWWVAGAVVVALALRLAALAGLPARTVAALATFVGCGVLLALPGAPAAAALLLLVPAALGVRWWRDLLLWQLGMVLALLVAWWAGHGLLELTAGGPDRGDLAATVVRGVALVWLGLAALLGVVADLRGRGSGDDDAVERRGGVADPYGDLLADGGDARA